MTPVEITNGSPDAHAVVFAKNQSQYRPLPAIRFPGAEGLVITRWQVTWRERFRILLGSGVFLGTLTFNQPLQPVKLGTTLREVE